jgi:hypothetical protein
MLESVGKSVDCVEAEGLIEALELHQLVEV